jgi:hypothetical protein
MAVNEDDIKTHLLAAFASTLLDYYRDNEEVD